MMLRGTSMSKERNRGNNMSKKKNVKSKKAKTLLKGVVAAGVAIGGVDMLADANVVYAAEGELDQFDTSNEVIIPSAEKSIAEEAAAATSYEQTTGVEENVVTPAGTVENDTAASAEIVENAGAPSADTVEIPENNAGNGITNEGTNPAEPSEDSDDVKPEDSGNELDETNSEGAADESNPTDT